MSPKTGLPRSITDEDFELILEANWEQLALFAFEKYKENGRGVVFLDRHGQSNDILYDRVDLGYAVYEPGQPDPDAARMIEQYDPTWEIVLQYLRPDGRVRTARIRTAPGQRHPWRIYLFERMMQDED
jgi:hypothetical protein